MFYSLDEKVVRDFVDHVIDRKPYVMRSFFPPALRRTWSEIVSYIDTHMPDDFDRRAMQVKMRLGLNRCELHHDHNSHAPASTVADLEYLFPRDKITLITFIGIGPVNESYPLHVDKMDVLYVQEIGSVTIKAGDWGGWLHPGDALWIPRGVSHQVQPQTSRVGLSFGVEGQDPAEYATYPTV